MVLKMVEPCPHDISEMDVAAQADGLCPLCLQGRLSEALALLRDYAISDIYGARARDFLAEHYPLTNGERS